MCADVLEPLPEDITALLAELGYLSDPSDLLLLRLLRVVANQSDRAVDRGLREHGLTGARLRLLLYLIAAEKRGTEAETYPSVMSQQQQVSRNTVSALIRSLEKQGLIERSLDPNDRRFFHIRVTQAGKDLARSLAPRLVAFMEQIIAGLDVEERHQLALLLGKLHRSFVEHGTVPYQRSEPPDISGGLPGSN